MLTLKHMLHLAIDYIAQNTTRYSTHIENLFNQYVRCNQLQTEKVVKFMPQVSITWMTQVSLA
ncbi:hypothetical protein E2B89_09715 [Salmonella enterica]|uniref:Uncharacterized protein n=4 Tax=Salmonella enterica TaxID=28901 RepID=A0A3L7M672_SALDZ|nr:hypothetical protein DOE63_13485 [Salmonella enterica subsp. diarizonae serovar 59:z10:-]AXC73700.1 hypothetical protein DOE59_20375 [Salmonella enterica subsp. diarizonae serovar 48:i:z]AXD70803.1 hypothetical protein CHC34_07330 [Salmonella enterica]EAA1783016.1 hypothetical protein [Salmonella enterica subsp. diarizonae]EAA7929091.1 hypothetical protein [Salmonella enterica subsp. enterica serovar Redlands]EAS9238041.1 hypothetical protein [Salmonella enterica subsp. enterica]EBH8034894